MICVARDAIDPFFDGLVREVKKKVFEKSDDEFLYHPDVGDRHKCSLDMLLLDEVNAKSKDDPGMCTIMSGVTPLSWMPYVANPNNKGNVYNPVLWLSTANREITETDYYIPAVLRRTHYRYIVHYGKLYEQPCYKILDSQGSFAGGFQTCQGTFGRWDELATTTSETETVDKDRNVTRSVTRSTGNSRKPRFHDTMALENLLCSHCKEVTLEDFICFMIDRVLDRLDSSLGVHNAVSGSGSSSCSSSLSSVEQ